MPQYQEPGIIEMTTERGLHVRGYDELDNRQIMTIRKESTEVLVQDDGSTKTTYHPQVMPYMITVEWLAHYATTWDLTNKRGRVLDNTVRLNIERYVHSADFEELQNWLFEQFGYRVMGVSEDLIEELKAEQQKALEENRGMEIPGAPPRPAMARGIDDDEEDEEDDDESAEGNVTPMTTKTTSKKSG